jgi:hypothetical protein
MCITWHSYFYAQCAAFIVGVVLVILFNLYLNRR